MYITDDIHCRNNENTYGPSPCSPWIILFIPVALISANYQRVHNTFDFRGESSHYIVTSSHDIHFNSDFGRCNVLIGSKISSTPNKHYLYILRLESSGRLLLKFLDVFICSTMTPTRTSTAPSAGEKLRKIPIKFSSFPGKVRFVSHRKT